MKYARESDAELQTKMMEASLPLIHTGKNQIGWMQTEIWASMQTVLVDQGILSAPIDIHQVYTLDFLETIYSDQ